MLTEVGTMNLFIFWKTHEGKHELVTPPLDGTILPGVTRDSILQLSRQWGEFTVSERPVTMRELCVASEEGRIVEMFGSGTAAIVSPIKHVRYVLERGADGSVTKFKVDNNYGAKIGSALVIVVYCFQDLMIPLDPKDPKSQAGPLTRRFSDTIMSIQYGEKEHPWSVLVD
jgi:branched-chain amino acid aminotransferase